MLQVDRDPRGPKANEAGNPRRSSRPPVALSQEPVGWPDQARTSCECCSKYSLLERLSWLSHAFIKVVLASACDFRAQSMSNQSETSKKSSRLLSLAITCPFSNSGRLDNSLQVCPDTFLYTWRVGLTPAKTSLLPLESK